MKYLRLTSVRLAIGLGVLVVAAAIAWRLAVPRSGPHVQVVLASDGALMVAGVPGRSLRTQIQNRSFWDGQSATSARLVEFLRYSKVIEEQRKTYDGQLLVIVDDHASFQIAKMLIASAREYYPTVSYVNGSVAELPRRGFGADKSYVKDCSAQPPPEGCTGH